MSGANDVCKTGVIGTEVGCMPGTASNNAPDAHCRVGHPVEAEVASSVSCKSKGVDLTANGMRRTRLEHMFRPLKP